LLTTLVAAIFAVLSPVHDLKVESLDRIPSFAVFQSLANAMLGADGKSVA
jgi:hypothetical protein